MGYRYIVLADTTTSGNNRAALDKHESALRAMGLQPCLTADSARVFVSPETPVLAVPGGLAIGHVFFRDGTPAKPDALPTLSSPEQFAKLMLAQCWGDYLLIQLCDGPAQRLEVLREPSGGVTCVYVLRCGSGFITSDISLATGLGLYQRQIDWEFIPQALAYPHAKTTGTGLVGVRELLPGCSLLVGDETATVREDWSPWTFVTSPHRRHDPHEAAADIRTTVASVVKAWAETDKSVLLELSGGLDSSIIASCLPGTSARVTCYNLVTPVPGADERRYASLMADQLGVELKTEKLCAADGRFSFALPPSSVAPRVATLQYMVDLAMDRAASANDTASFFSGGGGDTVFCYLRSAAPAADALSERGIAAGLSAIHDLSTLHQCTFWKAGRLTLRKLLQSENMRFKADSTFLDPSVTVDPPPRHPWLTAPANALVGDRERIIDLAGTQVFREITLRGTKRPLRLPLLSQPVMEACLKVPTWMWIAGGENRAIARAAFADVLPQEIRDRRSKGSFTNYTGAIYRKNKRQIREFLLQGHLHEHRLLDTRALESFFERDLSSRDTSFMRIFSLCATENWVRNQSEWST